MGKILKLPESLVRLIAAGEVIERPASVVKELVENSLDAGARCVSVDIWGSGRTRIRVTDDGQGMSPDDARLALDRHATSKLRSFDDLHHLDTFGFRGEALPSIAAVSRLELTTRTPDAAQGWMIRLEGGAVRSSQAAGVPHGTTIDVQDLFFNTPARSKFLKRDATERTHILKTLQEIALAHLEVRFEASFDGKRLLSLPAAQELGGRVSDLWGISVTENLVALDIQKGPCSIRGLVNAIPAHHPTRSCQTLFVNNRPVQQRMLSHAVYEAYKEWLPVGRHPVFVLFVTLDPALVDVNVHPTKREVRFSDERAVYDVLFSGIRAQFKNESALPSNPWVRSGAEPLRASPSFQENRSAITLQQPLLVAEAIAAAPDASWLGDLSEARYLGQFQKLYLLLEQRETLMLVDQHAAAERVLFERLLAQVSQPAVPRQALLTPLLWDVSPAQAEVIRSVLGELARMGFGLEPFGAQTFALKEWPAVLPEPKQAQRFLEDMLDAFENELPTTRTEIQHQIAARAACRAAIMAGDSISTQEVSQLLRDLSATDRPMTCPHGRPTIIRLTRNELDRKFKRL